MPDQDWTTVDCRDRAHHGRTLGLGRIRRDITLRTLAGETAILDLRTECTPGTPRP